MFCLSFSFDFESELPFSIITLCAPLVVSSCSVRNSFFCCDSDKCSLEGICTLWEVHAAAAHHTGEEQSRYPLDTHPFLVTASLQALNLGHMRLYQ